MFTACFFSVFLYCFLMRIHFFRSRSENVSDKTVKPNPLFASSGTFLTSQPLKQRRQRSSTEPHYGSRDRSSTMVHVMDLFEDASSAVCSSSSLASSLSSLSSGGIGSTAHTSLQKTSPNLLLSPTKRANSVQPLRSISSTTQSHCLYSKPKPSLTSWVSNSQSIDSLQWSLYSHKTDRHDRSDESAPESMDSDSSSPETPATLCNSTWPCYDTPQWTGDRKSEPEFCASPISTYSLPTPRDPPCMALSTRSLQCLKERTKLTPTQQQRRKTTVFETTFLGSPDFIAEDIEHGGTDACHT
ncbi:hypothetical protein BDF14DRAFT_1956890, partial [Spinellus fusiger]